MGLGAYDSVALVLSGDGAGGNIPPDSPPATIHVDAAGTSVDIQVLDKDDAWMTVETIDAGSSKILETQNQPAIRINPNGGTEFLVIWRRGWQG